MQASKRLARLGAPWGGGRAVSGWLASRDEAWLSAVERVALDPYRGYYNGVSSDGGLAL